MSSGSSVTRASPPPPAFSSSLLAAALDEAETRATSLLETAGLAAAELSPGDAARVPAASALSMRFVADVEGIVALVADAVRSVAAEKERAVGGAGEGPR